MKNKKQDRALQTEANPDKHINYFDTEDTGTDREENIESRRRPDGDSVTDGSFNEMLQHEIRIDPGNEHHHNRTDADDIIFDDDIDRPPKYDADAGGDGTGTT